MKYYKKIESPVGQLTLLATDTHLVSVLWENVEFDEKDPPCVLREHQPILKTTELQLKEYFKGSRKQFDIPILAEGTDFQKRVWLALRQIPYGETWSYKRLATHIGNPKASRAVGAANGKNPLSILVPCHRVVGAQGDLTGFAGGLRKKAILLSHEKFHC